MKRISQKRKASNTDFTQLLSCFKKVYAFIRKFDILTCLRCLRYTCLDRKDTCFIDSSSKRLVQAFLTIRWNSFEDFEDKRL